MSAMSHRTRRSAVALGSIGARFLLTALSGSASAIASKGIKGDPQPEMKPFKLGAATGAGGTVAIEANGDLVVAYGIATKNTDGATAVCVLARGGHTCTHRTVLNTLSDDSMDGTPQVYALAHDTIVVLVPTCCDAEDSTTGDDLLFTSTNGGTSFAAPDRVGSVGVGSAALIAGNIVFAGPNAHIGLQVESIPDNATAGPGSTAVPIDEQPGSVAVANYKGGALIAADMGGPVKVVYAPAGDDFNATASYKTVETFDGEELLGLSGNALLTQQSTGDNHVQVRFFNGTTFSAPHNVPTLAGHELGLWTTIDKDPHGVTHVFSEFSFGTPSYALEENSTTTGAHWSGQTDLGNAIDSDFFNVDLDSIGSGLVIGTDPDADAIGYPVLAHQSVTFAYTHSTVKVGHSITARGKATFPAAGRKVELQVARGSLWYDVKSTHESATGAFSFTIKGTHVGSVKYRAVAADRAGYIQFGYSAARTLKVVS
jgi:hypothetical protein